MDALKLQGLKPCVKYKHLFRDQRLWETSEELKTSLPEAAHWKSHSARRVERVKDSSLHYASPPGRHGSTSCRESVQSLPGHSGLDGRLSGSRTPVHWDLWHQSITSEFPV